MYQGYPIILKVNFEENISSTTTRHFGKTIVFATSKATPYSTLSHN